MKKTKEAEVVVAVSDLLKESYKEVLDAVKHQDDKIGRLFTGIAFLTAAALAMANLSSGEFIGLLYQEWPAIPPAIACLAAYLMLVFVAVTLLISSFGTPLRVPGQKQGPPRAWVDWVRGQRASQVYFSEISRLSISEWEDKWSGSAKALKREYAQSLVGETHNLAVRTQFKYGRMNEAIALFNLALLFLALTLIFCVSSAAAIASESLTSGRGSSEVILQVPAKWALVSAISAFVFIQLLSQIRYTRQTVDEVGYGYSRLNAFLRYAWVLGATAWVFLVGAGEWPVVLSWMSGTVAMTCLVVSALFEDDRKRKRGIESIAVADADADTALKREREREFADEVDEARRKYFVMAAVAFAAAIATRFAGREADFSLTTLSLALSAASLLTLFAVTGPTFEVWASVRRYRQRVARARLASSDLRA